MDAFSIPAPNLASVSLGPALIDELIYKLRQGKVAC